jgi:tryptophanyl-tRNA synthetase
MKRLFTGLQPTGLLGIGHYLGTIQPCLRYQSGYDCLFAVVDLHAITLPQSPQALLSRTRQTLALLIACGLDPDRHTLFVQSQVPAHTQLAWILSGFAHMGELNRMTQFKDKSEQKKHIPVSLYTYPVLMAADIMLYHAHVVPVGDDQKQHLELACHLIDRFNQRFQTTYPKPQALIEAVATKRVMSLQDPDKKMSKSDPNQMACINLLDSPDVVLKKCKRAVTDSDNHLAFNPEQAGLYNLLTIYQSLTNQTPDQIEGQFQGYGPFKQALAECINETLMPIQAKYDELIKDPSSLDQIMKSGAQKANSIADQQIKTIYQTMGLL